MAAEWKKTKLLGIIKMSWLKHQRRRNITDSNSDPSSTSDSLHSSNQAANLRLSFNPVRPQWEKEMQYKVSHHHKTLPTSPSPSLIQRNYFCGISDSWELCL